MLSIIICSRSRSLDKKFLENIEETVGCEHEIISIDNSANRYSIFEAYNLGLEKSKGAVVCFMHDDVFVHTHGWGELARKLFRDNPGVGLVGIAGAKIKSKMPSAWWECPEEFKILNLIQHLHDGRKVKWEKGFENSSETEVVLIDGAFMLLRKETGLRFNENLKGFHNYDMNICLECLSKGYRILATNRILIEHLSMGSIDKTWVNSCLEFQRTYAGHLPLFLGKRARDPKLLHKLEVENGTSFILRLLSYGYIKEALYFWQRLVSLEPFSRVHLKLLRNFRIR